MILLVHRDECLAGREARTPSHPNPPSHQNLLSHQNLPNPLVHHWAINSAGRVPVQRILGGDGEMAKNLTTLMICLTSLKSPADNVDASREVLPNQEGVVSGEAAHQIPTTLPASLSVTIVLEFPGKVFGTAFNSLDRCNLPQNFTIWQRS